MNDYIYKKIIARIKRIGVAPFFFEGQEARLTWTQKKRSLTIGSVKN